MKKILFLVVLMMFVVSCASSSLNLSGGGVEIVATGSGSTKDEALNNAFKDAVQKVSGTVIHSESKIKNKRLMDEKVLAYSKGFIKGYKIILYTGDEITIKTVVSPKLVIDALVDFNIIDSDAVERDLSKLDFAQHKIINNFQLMEKFIGNPSDYFDRAYVMKLTGYKIKSVGKNGASGYWIVNIALKSQFWDTWIDLLKNAEIEHSSESAISQGLYYGCSKDKYPSYTVPNEFGHLPLVEFDMPISYNRYGGDAKAVVVLNKNMMECVGCSVNDVDWTDGGCGGMGTRNGSAPEFTVFGSSTIIKVPFSGEDKESLESTLKGGYAPLSPRIERNPSDTQDIKILHRKKKF